MLLVVLITYLVDVDKSRQTVGTATHVQFIAYWRHYDLMTAVQLDLRWHGDCHGDGDVKGA